MASENQRLAHVNLTNFSYTPPAIMREILTALSEYKGSTASVTVDPVFISLRMATMLATYLRRVDGLRSLAFTTYGAQTATEAMIERTRAKVDVLLEAVTANAGVRLNDFCYGAIPAATPGIFHRFVNARIGKRAMVRIMLDQFWQIEAFPDTLRGVERIPDLCIDIGPAMDVDMLAAALSRSNIGRLTISHSAHNGNRDLSPVVRSLSPTTEKLQLCGPGLSLGSLQGSIPANSTLRELRCCEVVLTGPLPFCGLRLLATTRALDQPFGDEILQSILQLVDKNQSTLQSADLYGFHPRLWETGLTHFLGWGCLNALSVEETTRFGLDQIAFQLSRSVRSLVRPMSHDLAIRISSISDTMISQLFATVGQCTTLASFSFAGPRLCETTIRDVLLPALRSNSLAPAVDLPSHLRYHPVGQVYADEIAFYAQLRPRRLLLTDKHVARGLWADLLATADHDGYPGPSVLYYLLRRKADLLCEDSRRGKVRERVDEHSQDSMLFSFR